jgi:hypothetical protein
MIHINNCVEKNLHRMIYNGNVEIKHLKDEVDKLRIIINQRSRCRLPSNWKSLHFNTPDDKKFLRQFNVNYSGKPIKC